MLRWNLLVAAALVVSATPALAQDADVAPAVVAKPAVATVGTPAADSNVAPFYAAHPGTLIWLRDAETRAAAAKLVPIFKHAKLDGLADGPMLASTIEAAVVAGTPEDDERISKAWVRYVQALKRPVAGVSFGDTTLQLRAPSAMSILSSALAAPSLIAHIDSVASVNPFYSALRDEAIATGKDSDPHVLSTLDRLRLIPAKGKAILVDVANAQLMELEDGNVVDTMKVIVGKADFPTPLLAGKI